MVLKKQPFRKIPVLLAFLYIILTLGAYIGIWFYRRSGQLSKMANKKTGPFLNGLARVAALAGLISSGITIACYPIANLGAPNTAMVFWIVGYFARIFASISWIVLAFKTRRILLVNYKQDISRGMTFFFGALFLQYVINQQDVSARPRAKRRLKLVRNAR